MGFLQARACEACGEPLTLPGWSLLLFFGTLVGTIVLFPYLESVPGKFAMIALYVLTVIAWAFIPLKSAMK
jgi:hypothetical protein